jgi:hypothetical protein
VPIFSGPKVGTFTLATRKGGSVTKEPHQPQPPKRYKVGCFVPTNTQHPTPNTHFYPSFLPPQTPPIFNQNKGKMAYFDELLQRAITVRNNRAPASNTADLVGGVLVGIVTALQMLLDDKQDELTFDTAPTADSQNPVTSDGIYQALQAIDLSACEKIVNKVTSINAQSTDVQYPSAKLLYDQLQGLAAVYAPKVHTHPFADIERPANVASVNAQGYTITTAYYSHVLTITADATLHLPTMQSGAAIILRLTIIQDATGGRAVTFDGGAALVFNPYQTDLSLGQANYRCWVVLWFDGVNWAWLASPYVLRAESQFAYTIDGTTGSQYVTITINGTTMQIQATSGVWQYGYNNPINSIAFTGDTGVLNVDFTNSDGLANITTLADAFKNCAALVAVDFTGCDLSNVATAADCFAGCTSLAALTIPTGTWKPDIDLSACAAFTKAAMLAVIDGLYTYASGTHTVTFNSTVWDALSQADQQQVYNAADAKGWTTNAVAVSYVVSGTSSNVNGTETFHIQFIQDNAQTPDAAENITVNVDANGDWSFEYMGKKIASLEDFANGNSTLTSLDFTDADDLLRLTNMAGLATSTPNLLSIIIPQTLENVITAGGQYKGAFMDSAALVQLPNATFENATNITRLFLRNGGNTINLPKATFNSAISQTYEAVEYGLCGSCLATSISMPQATFKSLTNARGMFAGCAATTIVLSSSTFESIANAATMFKDCTNLQSVDFGNNLNMALVTALSSGNEGGWFYGCTNLQSVSGLGNQTFANVTNIRDLFRECRSLQSLDLHSAIFGNVTASPTLFYNCQAMTTIDLRSATFANNDDCRFFFYGCSSLVSIDLSSATLAKATRTVSIFDGCSALTTLNVPQNATAILPTSRAANAPMDLHYSPLTYASMLKVANWLSDLTGNAAHTVTFKTSAWNALTAAEQATIQGILSGKNWTLATA